MLEDLVTTCWKCGQLRPASAVTCPMCNAPSERRRSIHALPSAPRSLVTVALEQLGMSLLVLVLRVLGVVGLIAGFVAAYAAASSVASDGARGMLLFIAGLMAFALLWWAAYVLLFLRAIIDRLDDRPLPKTAVSRLRQMGTGKNGSVQPPAEAGDATFEVGDRSTGPQD